MESNVPECLLATPPSKEVRIEKTYGESIDIYQEIQSELAGPSEIVEAHVCLQNLAPGAPQRYCMLCQSDHKNLQLIVGLRFTNDAHVVKLDPSICYAYELEARVCVAAENRLFHLNYRSQSVLRTNLTLEYAPFELACPGLAKYDNTTLVKHVCLKIRKAKHMYVLETQKWHNVQEEPGPNYKNLYWQMLTNPPASRCDVLVRVGLVVLGAHKAVLCTKSHKLSKYFSDNPNVHEVHFTHVFPDVVQVTLKFFYTNELDRQPLGYDGPKLCDLLIRIYYFAKSHQFEQLRVACLDHIAFTVIPGTAPRYITFATYENLPSLRRSLQAYVQFYLHGTQPLPQPPAGAGAGLALQ